MTFATLALICAVSLLGPVLSMTGPVRLPVVVGELAVGVILGRTGLGLVHSTDPTFSFMAQVGFAVVMFIAGSHVPLHHPALRRGLGRGTGRALLVAAVAAPVGLGLGYLFGTGHGALYAVLLASSSASLVMPTLEGVEVSSTAGVEMLVQLAVADAATIVVLPLVVDPARARTAALGTAAVLACAVVAWAIIVKLSAHGWRRRLHVVSEDHHLAVEVRIVLVLLFALCAVAASTGVSVMLAGFCAGLVVSAAGEPRRVEHQVFALGEGFFAPIFFVWLGSGLDLRSLASHPAAIGLGLALGLAAVGVHSLGTLARQPWPLAAVTAAQLGVPVAAAALGTAQGSLAPGEATALLLGALVTVATVTLVSPRVRGLVRADTNC